MGATVINGQLGTIAKYVAGTTINANDLVINTSTGSALVANPNVTLGVNNNSTTGVTALYANTTNNASAAPSNQQGLNARQTSTVAQLANGIVVQIQGGISSSNPKAGGTFFLRNVLGGYGTLTYPTTFTSDTLYQAQVYKLTSTTFVIAWLNTSNVIKFQIYNNNGTTSGSTITVATTNGTMAQFGFNVLTGGNMVFSYGKVTSNNATFTIYNSSGTIVGSEVTASASENSVNNFILPMSNGNFAYYWVGYSTHNAKFGIYSSTGSVVNAVQTIGTGSVTPQSGSLTQIGVQLVNGNLVFQWYGPTPNYYFFANIYSSSGTLITSSVQLTVATSGTGNVDIYCGMCATATGFSTLGFIYNGTNGTFRSFDSNGLLQIGTSVASVWGTGSPTAWPSQYGSQASAGIQLIYLGSAGYTWNSTSYYGTNNCCGTIFTGYGNFGLISLLGTGGSLTSQYNINNAYSGILPIGDYNLFLCSDDTLITTATAANNSNYTQTYYGTYTIIQKSIAGVALEPSVSGQAFRVATSGAFTLNQTYAYGGTFNQTAATIVGAKGTLLGNQISLG